MPENSDKAPEKASAEQGLDIRLVGEIITQLNIIRKNTALYPRGHPQMEASLARALGFLEKHFAYSKELSLALTRDSVMVGDVELSARNPIFREYASVLHDRSVYSLILEKGLDLDNLYLFNRILSGDPSCTQKGEALDAALAKNSARFIKIELLDERKFAFEPIDEIDLDKQLEEQGSSGASWQSHIKKLLEKGAGEALTEDEDGIELTNVDPQLLADFLNKLEKGSGHDLSYDKAVAAHFKASSQDNGNLAALGDNQVRADFVELVESLDADFRSQLLSGDFLFSSRAKGIGPAVLQTAPAKILVDVLEDINKWKIKVEPKILKIIDTLAFLDSERAMPDFDENNWDEEKALEFSQMATSFLATAGFRKPGLRPERKRLAGRLEALANAEADCLEGARTADSVAVEMDQSAIAWHYSTTLLDLLERTKDEAEMELLARTLADCSTNAAKNGFWNILSYLWEQLGLLEKAAVEKRPPLAGFCSKARMQFWNPDNIERIAGAILDQGLKKSENLAAILREICLDRAYKVVDALALQEDPAPAKILTDIVVQMYANARASVMAHLAGQNPEAAIRMLKVVRWARDRSLSEEVKALAESKHQGVKLAAVHTLMTLGHKDSGKIITDFIDSDDHKLSFSAIAIARYINDRQVTGRLVEIVKDSRHLNRDFDLKRKQEALKSLSWIGAKEVLPELLALVKSRKFFSAKDFAQLKVDIYKSLEGYNIADIGGFIELGKKSDDITIVNICTGLEQKALAQKVKP
jgi:hypothetical protein